MNPLDKYDNIEYLGKGAFGVVRLYKNIKINAQKRKLQ